MMIPLARSYRRCIDRSLATVAMSHSTALAVMLLGRTPDGMRQGVLAEQMGMEPASIVPVIDGMARDALVERRIDPQDKRGRTLHLTETGRRMAAEAETRTAALRAEVFAEIDTDDLMATLRVLERLSRAVEAANQN